MTKRKDIYEHKHREICPLCGSKTLSPVYTLDGFNIDHCDDCWLQFVRNPWTAEALRIYYTQHYGKYNDIQGTQTEFVQRNKDKVLHLLRKHRAGSKILEIGCGFGTLLAYLQQHGYEVSGCEPCDVEYEFARGKLNLNVEKEMFHEGASFACGSRLYDAVIFNNVIEHIVDPMAFLALVRRILRPEGVVLLQTENFACRIAKDFGEKFWGNIPHTHVIHWTPETLQLALHKSGLEVIDRSFWAEPENIAWHSRLKLRRLFGLQGTWQKAYRKPGLNCAVRPVKSEKGILSLRQTIIYLFFGFLSPFYRTERTATQMLFVARAY
jgi:2-polyprenyl-3-methyl-5-hydroxy-6-metoxy-1,4-benzoquinol methylase